MQKFMLSGLNNDINGSGNLLFSLSDDLSVSLEFLLLISWSWRSIPVKKSSQWINFIKTLYVFIFQRNISCRRIFHTVVSDFMKHIFSIIAWQTSIFYPWKISNFQCCWFYFFLTRFPWTEYTVWCCWILQFKVYCSF